MRASVAAGILAPPKKDPLIEEMHKASSLIRQAWTTHRWDERPHRRP
ncbi:hypothetical protein [Streptomyces sp. NPDC001933]